jgi:hypothetical protein
MPNAATTREAEVDCPTCHGDAHVPETVAAHVKGEAETVTSEATGRLYYRVQVCDACGVGGRSTEMIALGRNGLSVLTAQLCQRCGSMVELAVERAIREIETQRMEREIGRRRGR